MTPGSDSSCSVLQSFLPTVRFSPVIFALEISLEVACLACWLFALLFCFLYLDRLRHLSAWNEAAKLQKVVGAAFTYRDLEKASFRRPDRIASYPLIDDVSIQEVQCSICMGSFEEAQQSPCEHVFCKGVRRLRPRLPRSHS